MTPKTKKRWVPSAGQRFYRVYNLPLEKPTVLSFDRTTLGVDPDWHGWKFNCFRTKREAQSAAKKITAILRGGK